MWDTMIKIKEAKRALQDGRLEEAFRLASDPDVKDHRRARDIRETTLERIYKRAVKHKDGQNLSQAYLDVNLLLTGGEKTEEAVKMARDIRKSLEQRKELEKFHGDLLNEARALLSRGALDQVVGLLEPFANESPAVDGLCRQIEVRRKECAEVAKRGSKEIKTGNLEKARALLASARRLDGSSGAVDSLTGEIERADVKARVDRAVQLQERGDLDAAWEELRYADATLPTLKDAREYKKIRDAMRKNLIDRFESDLDEGRFDTARDTLHRLFEFEDEIKDLTAWLQGIERIERAHVLRAAGELTLAKLLLEEAAKGLSRSKACDRLAKELKKEAQEVASAEQSAFKQVASGDPKQAISDLQAVVARYPQNKSLREQLHRIEDLLRDGSELFQKANGSVNRGDYFAAKTLALELCQRPGFGDRGQELRGQIHEVLDKTARDLAVAELALSGSTSGRGEIEEALRSVDVVLQLVHDHQTAQKLRSRLERSAEALAEAERGDGYERMMDLEGALSCHRAALRLWPENPRITLAEARLSRKVGGLALIEGERLYQTGETTLAGERVAEAISLLPASCADRRRAGALQKSIEQAQIEGDALLEVARERAAKGAYEDADRALDHLEEISPGRGEVQRIRRIIAKGREMEGSIGKGKARGAARRFEELAGSMRSMSESPEDRRLADRIHDRLSQGHGLGENFILRVEEGGEFLVLSGDTIRIGNVLSKEVELPIMANISRVHATIQRTRDFHRGDCYRVVPVGEAKCYVNGKAPRGKALSSGDRIRLGKDLEMIFELPTEKSVTALLHLQGDFEVDGISKILLMKPGGPDGKILISSGIRCHVPIKCVKRDIEIHRAGGDADHRGQLVCTSLSGVEVNGNGGRPEERIGIGSLVQCGDLKFTIAART